MKHTAEALQKIPVPSPSTPGGVPIRHERAHELIEIVNKHGNRVLEESHRVWADPEDARDAARVITDLQARRQRLIRRLEAVPADADHRPERPLDQVERQVTDFANTAIQFENALRAIGFHG